MDSRGDTHGKKTYTEKREGRTRKKDYTEKRLHGEGKKDTHGEGTTTERRLHKRRTTQKEEGTHLERRHARRGDICGEGTNTGRGHTRRGNYIKKGLTERGKGTHTERRLHGKRRRDTHGKEIIERRDYSERGLLGKRLHVKETIRKGDFPSRIDRRELSGATI